MSRYIQFDEAFPDLKTKDFKKMALLVVNNLLPKQGVELVGDLEFSFHTPYQDNMSYVGYTPMSVYIKYTQKYMASADVSEKYTKDRWPGAHIIGGLLFDMSNCGMGSIHNISNLGYKGFGIYTLNLLEQIMLSVRRKKIMCSINTGQKKNGADKWLERFGYDELDTFVGGNSGQQCYIYSKDLSKQDIVQVRPVKDVKP